MHTEFGATLQADGCLGSEKERRQSTARDPVPARLRVLIEGSSAAGLSHATSVASGRAARAFWTLVLLCGLSGLLVNLTIIVRQFLKEPILSEIKHDYRSLTWPDITICNPSSPVPFSSNERLIPKWDKLLRRVVQMGSWKTKIYHFRENDYIMSSINHREFQAANSTHLIAESFFIYQSKQISYSSGMYDRIKADPLLKGHVKSRMVHDPLPVACFCLKADDAFGFISKIRPIESIELTLQLNFHDYLRFNSSSNLRGVHVYITPPDSSIVSFKPTEVMTGVDATFDIAMSKLHRVRRKSRCRREPFFIDLYDATLTKSRVFLGEFKDCRYFVSQSTYLRECGCYNPFLPIHVSKQVPPRLCLNMSLYSDSELERNVNCMRNVYRNNSRSPSTLFEREMQKCYQYRLPLCDEDSYKIDKREYRWPTTRTDSSLSSFRTSQFNFFKYFNGSDKSKFLNQNFMRIWFASSRDYVEVINEELGYPLPRLISDIGGLLGLWTGISVIGIIEMLEILAWLVVFLGKKVRFS